LHDAAAAAAVTAATGNADFISVPIQQSTVDGFVICISDGYTAARKKLAAYNR
jgi:predicted transcriptional regulator